MSVTILPLFLLYYRIILCVDEIKIPKEKAQKAKIQQRKIPSQSRPRERNRTVRQAGEYAAVEGA